MLYLKSANDGMIKILGDRIRKDPKLKIPIFNYDDAADYIKDNYVLIVVLKSKAICKLFGKLNGFNIGN